MHVHMVFTHHTLQYPDIFRVTDLDEQLSTSLLYLTSEHMKAVLGYPHKMHRQPGDGMPPIAVFAHLTTVSAPL